MSRYSGPNVGGVHEVRVFTFDQIASISDPVSGIVTLTLNSGVSNEPLPVTPDTAEPDIQNEETDGGNLVSIKFPFDIPRVDTASRAIVEAFEGRNVVVVYLLKTGLQFILGTTTMPMRCVRITPRQASDPEGGTNYQVSFEGFALDDPYQCAIVAP